MSVNYPLLFFLLLIPLSGFIAWAGDRIGHRIGKRRHTILRLRPRYTATLTTVAAGMLIALISFGVMWASNATFRRVLRDGAALYADNRALRNENQTLLRYVADQREEARLTRVEAQAALDAKKRADNAQQLAERSLLDAQAQVRSAKATLGRATRDLEKARGDLRVTQAQLRDKEARVAAAARQVREAEARQRTAQRQADAARVAAREAEKLVDNAQRSLKAVNEFHETTRRTHQEELAKLTAELEARRAERDNLLGVTLANTTVLRRNKITYEVGEELERTSLPAGLATADLQMRLWRLLTQAAEKATARGATAAESGRAVVILPKQVSMDPDAQETSATSADEKTVDEADSVAAAAEAIRQAGEDVAVLVVASTNAVQGEPVPVELRTYRNRWVLKKDAVVGKVLLDGTRPQQVIADTLYTFLRADVRKRLRDAGVIPPASGGGSRQADESLVSISGDQWFQVLDEVRRAGPSAQVVVRAAADLRAADPVTLHFEVTGPRDVSSTRP